MRSNPTWGSGFSEFPVGSIVTPFILFKTLFNNKQMYHTMKTIRSKNHQLGSYELNKVSLSCFDGKRYIHENGITSYAYGYYKIE